MKILLIRHGDPDYSIDNLTPKGKVEAKLLSNRLAKEPISKIYCSPLGRARATAAPTAEKFGLEPEIHDWMQEVPVGIKSPEDGHRMCPWHLMPDYWMSDPRAFDKDEWVKMPVYADSDMPKVVAQVRAGADELMASHGYVRRPDECGGRMFTVTDDADRDKTVAIFAHLGLGCLLLSMLTPVSPLVLWESYFMPTTSVTTVFTEERPFGNAIMRVAQLGDTSHLAVGGEPTSNSGLFDNIW